MPKAVRARALAWGDGRTEPALCSQKPLLTEPLATSGDIFQTCTTPEAVIILQLLGKLSCLDC